jgi:hypothetical protein
VIAKLGLAMSPKTREIVSRFYDHIEVALWAILFAFVIYFIAFVMPNVSETQAQREIIRVHEIVAENEAFCEKLDIKRGTNSYNQCLLDIGQFRLNAEKRVIDFVY